MGMILPLVVTDYGWSHQEVNFGTGNQNLNLEDDVALSKSLSTIQKDPATLQELAHNAIFLW